MMNRHMKRHLRALGLLTAMVTLSAHMAAAAITTDDVIATYQADGFTRVEVRVGVTQMKVEAIKGNTKIETIYDIATGAVLKTETETVRAGENTAPGVSVRERNRDFVRISDDSNDDDNSNDDTNDDNSNDDSNDDDSSDDNSNDDDNSSDDDQGDDHGGDRDDDSSDDSNDDNDDHGGDRDDSNDDDSGDDHGGHGGGSDDD